LIFHEGKEQEKIVIRSILDAGFDLIEGQRAYKDQKANITGHIDGKIKTESGAFPIEIKSCSPFVFDKLSAFSSFQYYEAIQNGIKTNPYMSQYRAQMQLYLFFSNEEWGLTLFKNKSSGQLIQFYVKLDIDYVDGILKKAEKINKIYEKWLKLSDAKQKDAKAIDEFYPERIKDRDICKSCKFNHICLPDIKWGEPLKMEKDPQFEEKIDRWLEGKETAADYTKLNTAIKDGCKGRANVIIGKYHITGKETASGSWKKEIKLIKLEGK